MTAGKRRKSNVLVTALGIFALFCIVILWGAPQHTSAGWFKKSDRELLHQALTSENPRTVEKCLNTFIKKQNHTAVLQIKHHARTMRFAARRKLNSEQKLNPDSVKKQLAPWVHIEQKADLFFKRTATNQKNTPP